MTGREVREEAIFHVAREIVSICGLPGLIQLSGGRQRRSIVASWNGNRSLVYLLPCRGQFGLASINLGNALDQ
jgi:hypothetical protein